MCRDCSTRSKGEYIQLFYFTLWTITILTFVFAVSIDTVATSKQTSNGTVNGVPTDFNVEYKYGWEALSFEYSSEGSEISHHSDFKYCDGVDEHAEQSDKDKFDNLCDDGKIYVAFAVLSAIVGGVTLILDFMFKCCCTPGSCGGSCAKGLIVALYCCTFVGMVLTVIIIFEFIIPNTESDPDMGNVKDVDIGTFEDSDLGITTMLMIVCVGTSGIALMFNFCFGCCCDSEVEDDKKTIAL